MHKTVKLDSADEKRLASWAKKLLWGLVILIPIVITDIAMGITDGSVGPLWFGFMFVYGGYGPFLGVSMSLGSCAIYFAKRAGGIEAEYNACVRGVLLSIFYATWIAIVVIVT